MTDDDEITAHLVNAHGRLIEALVEVRKRFDGGADDWRHSLLRTFREYCIALQIDRELIDPLQRMLNEVDDATLRERRSKAGQPIKQMPVGRAMAMAWAAAAVSELKARKVYSSTSSAARAVAMAIGIQHKEITNFRDNINRGLVSELVRQTYKAAQTETKNWSPDDILNTLKRRLRTFVK